MWLAAASSRVSCVLEGTLGCPPVGLSVVRGDRAAFSPTFLKRLGNRSASLFWGRFGLANTRRRRIAPPICWVFHNNTSHIQNPLAPNPTSSFDIYSLPPCEAIPSLANQFVENMRTRYSETYEPPVAGGAHNLKLGPIPTSLKAGKTRWRYPASWLQPLWWYWSNLKFPTEPSANDRGTSWIEIAVDFEMATRATIRGKIKARHGDADTRATMFQRAANMLNASQRLMAMCGNSKLPSNRNLVLCQLGSAPIAGIKRRPNLMSYDAVFLELANQALVHKSELGEGSNHTDRANRAKHWRWTPNSATCPSPCGTASRLPCPLPFVRHEC